MEIESKKIPSDAEIVFESSLQPASSLSMVVSQSSANINHDQHFVSAHRIGHDPWYQLGVILALSFNCGYVLGFSNLVLRPLGWTWGSICMIILGAMSFYSSCLLAKLHIIDGRRFIRYRDMVGYTLGTKMYYATWVLQFVVFILQNMGFLLLSGRAMKQIYLALNASPQMTLQEFIIISGGTYFVFSILVPNLSRMKVWSGISAFLTMIYITAFFIISISDGKSHTKNYKIIGSTTYKVFNSLNAVAAIIFMHNSGMVPEIQATLKQPVIKNMWKGLGIQFSAGLLVYYGVTIIGYWAYGSSVSEYVLNDLSGPKWAKLLANIAVVLQSIISQQLFCTAIHETVDTKFFHLGKEDFSMNNILVRTILRAVFFTFNTFFACMLPFLGDFVNLVGSLSLIPLTFVIPALIYIKVKYPKLSMLETTWHCIIILAFSVLTIATVVSSLHGIIDNARTYHLFANT